MKKWVNGKVYVFSEDVVYSDCETALKEQFDKSQLGFFQNNENYDVESLKFSKGEEFRKIEEDPNNKFMGELKFLHMKTGVPITFMFDDDEDILIENKED